MIDESPKRMKVKAVSVTHAGRVRDENEDAVFCDPDTGLFILADGMGGHSSGKVASTKAIEVIKDYLLIQSKTEDFEWPFDPSSKLSEIGNHLSIALRISNVRVYNEAQKDDDLLGMGTTGIIAIVDNDNIAIAHVGD
ncbi:MAG: protein phosphatase 2C domain-containing protein, partial [Bradymonadia bacterium]